MSIIWFSEKTKKLIATISKNNITLNKPASDCIPDAYNVMLGLSIEDRKVFIKALNKEVSIRGDIPETDRYKITIGSSYARISNKDFIKSVSKVFNINFDSPKKYEIEYNEDEHILAINISGEVEV